MGVGAAAVAVFVTKCQKDTLKRPSCPGGCPKETRLWHHEWCQRRVIIRWGEEDLYEVTIRVMRWKCACGRSFRNLPEGILPYCRYVMAAMAPCLLAVLKGKSYLNASVEVEGEAQIEALTPQGTEGCTPAPSTVWRWVGSLARISRHLHDRLSEVLSGREQAIQLPLPGCRSAARRGIWGLCLQALVALGRIPPDFATPLGGG